MQPALPSLMRKRIASCAPINCLRSKWSMQYRVTHENGHTVTIAPAAGGEGFVPIDLSIDLSQRTLIVDPNQIPSLDPNEGQPGCVGLHGLADSSRYAFKALSGLDPQQVFKSPLLSSLIEFGNNQLEPLLTEVTQEWPPSGGEEEMLKALASEPKRLEALLGEIVRQIDGELPGYFRPEKETGVWEWLKSGGSSKIPYSVGGPLPFSDSLIEAGQHLITDFARARVVFDLSSRTAHVGCGVAPTPHTVLLSLCTAGTLGEEVVDLNRAALLDSTTTSLQSDIAIIKSNDPVAAARKVVESNLENPPKSELCAALSAGSAAAIIAAMIIVNVLEGTVSAIDVLLGVFAVLCAQASAILAYSYRATKSEIDKASAQKAQELEQLLGGGRDLILHVFPSALIRFYVNRSGGRQHTSLGEPSELFWKMVIGEVNTPDLTILPTCDFTTPSGTPTNAHSVGKATVKKINGKNDICTAVETFEMLKLAKPQLLRAVHIEHSAAVCYTAHAIELLRDLAEMQRIHVPPAMWLDYVANLRSNSYRGLDERGTHPDISEAFKRLTGHLQINRPSWDRIALALQAASTLERIRQTRVALAITREAIRAEAARSRDWRVR
jgi:hypothetical protein